MLKINELVICEIQRQWQEALPAPPIIRSPGTLIYESVTLGAKKKALLMSQRRFVPGDALRAELSYHSADYSILHPYEPSAEVTRLPNCEKQTAVVAKARHMLLWTMPSSGMLSKESFGRQNQGFLRGILADSERKSQTIIVFMENDEERLSIRILASGGTIVGAELVKGTFYSSDTADALALLSQESLIDFEFSVFGDCSLSSLATVFVNPFSVRDNVLEQISTSTFPLIIAYCPATDHIVFFVSKNGVPSLTLYPQLQVITESHSLLKGLFEESQIRFYLPLNI